MVISHKYLTSPTVLLAVLIFCGFSFGQEKIEISTDPPPAAINFPVVREVGLAKVRSWAGRNQLISEARFVGITVSKDEWINLQLRFVSEGKTVQRPAEINLFIYPGSTERKYVDDRTLKIVTDGKPFLSSTSTFMYANTDGHLIVAALKVPIPYNDFVKLAESKTITLQVGPTTFALSDKAIEGFRDILKTIE